MACESHIYMDILHRGLKLRMQPGPGQVMSSVLKHVSEIAAAHAGVFVSKHVRSMLSMLFVDSQGALHMSTRCMPITAVYAFMLHHVFVLQAYVSF